MSQTGRDNPEDRAARDTDDEIDHRNDRHGHDERNGRDERHERGEHDPRENSSSESDEGAAAMTAVSAFIASINAHDVGGLLDQMTADHLFVDSLGSTIQGREAMRAAWHGYFRMFPDFHIEIEQQVARGSLVLACGQARGTYGAAGPLQSGDSWSAPAAWRVVIRDRRVAEWQVYCDNEPARRVLALHT
jgi:ketosteroid isomerase-like protein